jgi:7,8-dihydropterin-6-yl-methyl-4-(beta-D-ribofuranosyl)aminobenzene 5'-phosphate synthase
MSCDAGLIPYSASFLLVMFCAANLSAAPMPPAAPTQAQITVLYDAFGKSSDMHKDWGYAALVEYGGKRILFDTGNNPDILAHNAQVKGIDLSKLDFVVMSHRHGITWEDCPTC